MFFSLLCSPVNCGFVLQFDYFVLCYILFLLSQQEESLVLLVSMLCTAEVACTLLVAYDTMFCTSTNLIYLCLHSLDHYIPGSVKCNLHILVGEATHIWFLHSLLYFTVPAQNTVHMSVFNPLRCM